jgi:tetratricopeptide (TPR) repeat protein
MNNLAGALYVNGQPAEAEKLLRETLDIQRRVLGPEHPDTLLSMGNLAHFLTENGRYTEAEKLYRQTLDIRRRVLGPDHPNTAGTIYSLGCIAARKGNRDEALSLLQEAVEHGLSPATLLDLEKDPALSFLHGDPRFTALVARAKERAAKLPNARASAR